MRDGEFDQTISQTLICLIPKVEVPNVISQFRPISLCNVLYKILTKVLVNRLRPLLSAYIGPYQSAFLPGRCTSGSAIVLQEVVTCLRKKYRKACDMVIKIDFDKAYDSVRWSFLELALMEMELPPISLNVSCGAFGLPRMRSFGMGLNQPPSPPPEVFAKATHYLLTCSLLSWRDYPDIFKKKLLIMCGSQCSSVEELPLSPILFLRTIFYFLPMLTLITLTASGKPSLILLRYRA